jgi:hypothetical protein
MNAESGNPAIDFINKSVAAPAASLTNMALDPYNQYVKPGMAQGAMNLGMDAFNVATSLIPEKLTNAGVKLKNAVDSKLPEPKQKLELSKGDYKLPEQEYLDLNSPGWINTAEHRAANKVIDRAQYGPQPTPQAHNFVSGEEYTQGEMYKFYAQTMYDKLRGKLGNKKIDFNKLRDGAMKLMQSDPSFRPEAFNSYLDKQIQMTADGTSPFSEPHRGNFRPLTASPENYFGQAEYAGKKFNVSGDQALLSKNTVVQPHMLNVRPEFLPDKNWNSKAMGIYRNQLEQAAEEFQPVPYTGKQAFSKLTPNKKGGQVKKYKEGGEYNLSKQQIADLRAQGYEIEEID